MSRVSIQVNKDLLKQSIQNAEKNGPLKNRSALFEKVSQIYNKTADEPISPSVVYLRFTEWELECKTPKGKRGRKAMTEEQKAAMQAGRKAAGPRRSKAAQFKEVPDFDQHVAQLKKVTPNTFSSLVERTVKGSRTAAAKLHCLQCVGFSRSDVRDCKGYSCPMYLFRPYQKNDEDILEGDEIE